MAELANQVAIISGGLGDIGRACAVELARCGADVAVGGRSDGGRAEPLRAEIEALDRRCRFDLVDVGDAEAVRKWVHQAEADLGPVGLIIPNAAVVEMAPLAELTPEIWQRHLDVNLTGAFNLAHAAGQRLLELKRPGRIVFIGSWAAHAPHEHIPAYCVAKAGLRMLCRCMALEYAAHGILVNEVAPGFVDAGLSKQIFERHPQRRARAVAKVPTAELMDPREVALHVVHLCDPHNRSMTGSVLLCDGGLSLVNATWRGFDAEQADP